MSCAFKRRPRNASSPLRRPEWTGVFGRRGERAAVRHLKRRGYRVIARNYRRAGGEIDIVLVRDGLVVFAEVKTRSSSDAREPMEAVHPDQWRRIERAARYFLSQHHAEDRTCRFDLVIIVWGAETRPTIEHIEDAYCPASW